MGSNANPPLHFPTVLFSESKNRGGILKKMGKKSRIHKQYSMMYAKNKATDLLHFKINLNLVIMFEFWTYLYIIQS